MMMYDAFSSDYDRFVNWPGRLSAELPFLTQQLQAAGAQRVLDAACGTGMHAIALAQRGFSVVGADLSSGMIDRARLNATSSGLPVQFVAAGFGELAQSFSPGSFDALLCLGNSLPHVLTSAGVAAALADFAACLRPGGLLLVQNRNFDAVTARQERWMEPQSHREGGDEWVFLRFYDFDSDNLITFNVITLRRSEGGSWSQQVAATRLRPLLQGETFEALAAAGFGKLAAYGGMGEAPFDPASSGNLVMVGRRTT